MDTWTKNSDATYTQTTATSASLIKKIGNKWMLYKTTTFMTRENTSTKAVFKTLKRAKEACI